MIDHQHTPKKKSLRHRARLVRYSAIIIMVVLLLILAVYAHAAEVPASPAQLIQQVSNTVIEKLHVQKDIANHPQVAYAIIRQYVEPHVDSIGMGRSVIGRARWQAASPEEQVRFTKAFTATVMHTYAAALAQYTDQSVRVLPQRDGEIGQRVLVKTQIIGSGSPFAVNYRLVRKGNTWKVYDFNVEGVSMLRSFRSQFDAQLGKNNRLTALTTALEQHNRDIS